MGKREAVVFDLLSSPAESESFPQSITVALSSYEEEFRQKLL